MVKPIKLATWVKGTEEAAIYFYTIQVKDVYSVAQVLEDTRFYDDLESAETYLITNGFSKLR